MMSIIIDKQTRDYIKKFNKLEDDLRKIKAKLNQVKRSSAVIATGSGGGSSGSSSSTTNDASAFHSDVANEIDALTEKTAIVDADLLLIEDSEASNVKKKVQVTNIVDSLKAEIDALVLDHDSLANVSTSDHHVKYTDAEAVDALEAVSGAVIVSGDSILFIDATDGVMKQELVSDLLTLNRRTRFHANEVYLENTLGIGYVDSYGVTTTSTGSPYLLFSLPTVGTVTQLKMTWIDTNAADYIDQVIVEYSPYDGNPISKYNDTTNLGSGTTGVRTDTFNITDIALREGDVLTVTLLLSQATSRSIQILSFEVEY